MVSKLRTLALAIIDKRSNTLAGVTAFKGAEVSLRSINIGLFLILPSYKESNIPSNAITLMLERALNPVAAGGWELVRVQWRIPSLDTCKANLATRMLFTNEGTMRWSHFIQDGVDRQKMGKRRPLPPSSVDGAVW